MTRITHPSMLVQILLSERHVPGGRGTTGNEHLLSRDIILTSRDFNFNFFIGHIETRFTAILHKVSIQTTETPDKITYRSSEH